MDFLQKHGNVLDFTTMPVTTHDKKRPPTNTHGELQPILEATRKTKNTIYAIAIITESDEDITVQFHCLMLPPSMKCMTPKILTCRSSLRSTKNCFAICQGKLQQQSIIFQQQATL